jgi:hypothetical protein
MIDPRRSDRYFRGMKLKHGFTAATVLFLCGHALAHDAHDHDAPRRPAPPAAPAPAAPAEIARAAQHGGQVFALDAKDGLSAEALFSATGVELWFFDKDMTAISPPATAKLTLTVGKEVRKLEAKLDEKKPDRLAIESPLPPDGKVALFVQASVHGKKRSVRVEREVPKPLAAPATTTP